MIVKLKGKVESFSEDFIDIDCQGIIFRIFVTENLTKKINKIGEFISLHIFEIIKEDARLLFGFEENEEREIFSDLLIVQGVGGKMALNIMSKMGIEEITESILKENHQKFMEISGVGNKLALRIINELKEKVKKKDSSINYKIQNKKNDLFLDLVSCLENLGYQNKISQEISNRVISENDKKKIEDLIPIALKYLSKPRKINE